MKRGFTFLMSVILLASLLTFTLAQEEPSSTTSIGEEDYQQINDAVGQIPIDDQTGGLDKDKLNQTKTKAEGRIDAINEWLQWTDPVFNFVFKIPLRFNWEFAYLFFLVLFSLSAFHNLPNTIMDREWVNWLVGFGMTFVFCFFGVFKLIVDWIVLVTNKWWWDLVVLGVIIVGITVMGWIAVWQRKRRIRNAENKTIESGKRAEEEAEHIGKLGDALNEGFTEGAGI